MFFADYNHYSDYFIAFGKTEYEARRSLHIALNAHARLMDLRLDWYDPKYISVEPVVSGKAYRSGNPLVDGGQLND